MRLLVINYEFPPLGSGASNATYHIARELSRRGHAIVVLTSRFKGLPRSESIEDFEVVRIRTLRKALDRCPPHELLSFAIASIPAALKVAGKSKPDVALAFFGFPCGPAAWAVSKRLGIPYVLSLRNADVPRRALSESKLLQAPMKCLVRWLWRRADGLVSVSAGLRDEVLKLEPGLKVRVIPNGVDMERFHPRPDSAPRKWSAARPFKILYVGRLRAFKGLQDLVAALPAVRQKAAVPVQADLVGDGPYRETLESRIGELGLQNIVRFRGRLAREEMPDVYREADLLVLPSYAEGMPNAVLEAFASGVPVVATDIEGSRELLRSGVEGVLVPTHSPDALARAIISLASDPGKPARCGAAARERAMSFSWERVADEYLEIMNGLLKRGR